MLNGKQSIQFIIPYLSTSLDVQVLLPCKSGGIEREEGGTDVRLAGIGGGQISGPIAGGMGKAGKGIPAAPIWATAVSAAKEDKNNIHRQSTRSRQVANKTKLFRASRFYTKTLGELEII
uniref:Bm13124 n=1 Tax=Brugia malayi TaxID=6279 RepID=A0A1I9G0J6_BRUMA|nr:Bm13124 [Brugia malayi]